MVRQTWTGFQAGDSGCRRRGIRERDRRALHGRLYGPRPLGTRACRGGTLSDKRLAGNVALAIRIRVYRARPTSVILLTKQRHVRRVPRHDLRRWIQEVRDLVDRDAPLGESRGDQLELPRIG